MHPSDPRTPAILLADTRRAAPGPPSPPSDFLGLFLLAAVLEKQGYQARVFHGPAHEFPAVLEKLCAELRLIAVGFSCDFENRTAVEELCRLVRRKYRRKTIVGGPQAIALGEEFFRTCGCSFAVRGEAEEILPALVGFLIRGKPALAEIPGISYLSGGKVIRNADAVPPQDLDALPFPAYHLSLTPGASYGRTVSTGRGCPFSCAFCYKDPHGRKVRNRDIGQVIREIRENLIRNPRLRYLYVSDDTFTADPARVTAFCREIARLHREHDFVWFCEGHVQPLARRPGMLAELAEAGLARLQIGIESLDQDVLDLYNKKGTVEEIEFVVRQAMQAGIPQVAGNLIVGGPLETPERFENLLQRTRQLLEMAPGALDISTGFLRPYPGTEVTSNPQRFGLRILDPEGSSSVDDFPLVVPEGQTAEEVLTRRLRLAAHIRTVMSEALQGGRVPHERILSSYRLHYSYGLTSLWKALVYAENPALEEYYRLVSRGEAVRLADIPPGKIGAFHPLRTTELRKNLVFIGEVPHLDGKPFSPLEWEILLQSSGKQRLDDMVADLKGRFPQEDLERAAMEVLRKFDAAYLVTFSEY